MKIFISYSHEDEPFVKELQKHLSMLKRQGSITLWTDREIISGQEWGGEIDENLEGAGIIILLVSPDFIASDYCYEKEMERAIEKHELGQVVVVPIIIRSCDWGGAPFSKIQGLPKGVKALSLWTNKDEAWLNVVEGLKDTISEVKKTGLKIIPKDIVCKGIVNEEFGNWLDDTEIELKHRRLDKVTLKDVFVWPDLKSLSNDIDHVAL